MMDDRQTQYPTQIAHRDREEEKERERERGTTLNIVPCKNLQFLRKEIEISRVLIDARAVHRSTRSRESRAPAHATPTLQVHRPQYTPYIGYIDAHNYEGVGGAVFGSFETSTCASDVFGQPYLPLSGHFERLLCVRKKSGNAANFRHILRGMNADEGNIVP